MVKNLKKPKFDILRVSHCKRCISLRESQQSLIRTSKGVLGVKLEHSALNMHIAGL